MSDLAIALESAELRAAGFRHGFSTRRLSFKPLTPEALESIAIALRLDPARIFIASQVHGARAIFADGSPEAMQSVEADAIVACGAGDAVAVRIADCVPVLLADSETGAVAAVHAGWKGFVAGVVERAIALGAERGARFDIAAIGPCIEACCFEVGTEVAAQLAQAAGDDGIVTRAHSEKAFVDLRRGVRLKLARAGIRRIDDVAGCTRCDHERFFSYRRDREASGRHLAVIASRTLP